MRIFRKMALLGTSIGTILPITLQLLGVNLPWPITAVLTLFAIQCWLLAYAWGNLERETRKQ